MAVPPEGGGLRIFCDNPRVAHRQLCSSDWLWLEVLPALAFLAAFYLALGGVFVGLTFGGSGGGGGLLDDDEAGNSSYQAAWVLYRF